MNRTSSALVPPVFAAAMLLAQLVHAAEVDYVVTKDMEFDQTGVGLVSPDPAAPFFFGASASVAGNVTIPDGPTYSMAYVSADSDYELTRGFPSQASLDASFPSGTYVFSGTGDPTIDVAISGDLYPPVPQVTNGTWNSSGQLVIDATKSMTLYFNGFPGYAIAGTLGEAGLYVYASDGTLLVSDTDVSLSGPYTPSYTIPANTLTQGATYSGSLTFATYIVADATTVANTVLLSSYMTSTSFTIVTQAAATTPVAISQPGSLTVATGSTAVFSYTASGTPSPTYQWYLNSEPIAGATSPTLIVSGSTSANAGIYYCVASNSAGSNQSNNAQLTVTSTSNPGRLTNLSCRAQVGTGANVVIAGFVVGGSGTAGSQTVLVRGSGPALGLAPFNVPGVLADPKLTLNNVTNNPNTLVTEDTGWGGSSAIASAAGAVGAFPWSATSADSAALQSLAENNYTAEISGAASDTGVALVEVYDATPAGTYTPTSPRLTNLSARVQVGTGANVVFAGFVVGGSTARTVLIRASGPAIATAPFNVPGTLSDPSLTLSNVGVTPNVILATNTGWGGAPSIQTAAASVGAFPWSASSADSAILITLPPGNYTAGVAGASGDTGIALVEVYEVE